MKNINLAIRSQNIHIAEIEKKEKIMEDRSRLALTKFWWLYNVTCISTCTSS